MGEVVRGRMSLAYRELEAIPSMVAKRYADEVTELDLSNNKLTEISSLAPFLKLQVLILDHNKLTSQSKFPVLPELRTLWLNHNKISNLAIFIDHIAVAFPRLRHLSMLYNDACPNYFNNGTPKEYSDYRLFVISRLRELKMLDDQVVLDVERKESIVAYAAYKTTSVHSQAKISTATTTATTPRVMIKSKKSSRQPASSSSPTSNGHTTHHAAAGHIKPVNVSSVLPPGYDTNSLEFDAKQIASQQQQATSNNDDSDWSSDDDEDEDGRVRSISSADTAIASPANGAVTEEATETVESTHKLNPLQAELMKRLALAKEHLTIES